MRPRSADLIRPLLAVTRQDVLEHLSVRGLPHRDDETNDDVSFTRNRVRHELIPYLESRFNPRVRAALARSAELLAAETDWVSTLVPPARPEPDGSVVLSASELRASPAALGRLRVRRALEAGGGLRGITAVHVERVLRLARRRHGSGRWLALPGGRSARLSFDRLRIGPTREESRGYELPLLVPGRVRLPGGLALIAEPAPAPAVSDPGGEVVAAPAGPLVVRTRRAGDRVRVRGRALSLKRYLIAQRVPAEERGRMPLVAAGSEIVWMPGQPLQGAGNRYLSLHLEPS
jgi:tRNA(Ile)-lysidine synthase